MNFEAPLTTLVWLTSIVSVVLTYVVSYLLIPDLGGDPSLWWKLSTVITCGTLAGAHHPRAGQGLHLDRQSRHVREVVTSSREGGASLNILSGFVAGNFSAFWLGLAIMVPDGHRLRREHPGPGRASCWRRRSSPSAWWPSASSAWARSPSRWTRYGPVTDNAQSVFELSTIEQHPGHRGRDQAGLRLRAELRDGQAAPGGERRGGQHLQGHRQAGAHRHGRRRRHHDDLLDHPGAHRTGCSPSC